MIKIDFEGLKKTIRNLDDIERGIIEQAFEEALQDLAEKIGEISESYVPVDEGMLKNSFTVQKIKGQWVCGYNKEYAAYQHEGVAEDGSRKIENRPGSGQSHFLSEPVRKHGEKLLRFLQERLGYHIMRLVKL